MVNSHDARKMELGRGEMGQSAQPEFLHAAPQRTGIQAEMGRRTARSVNAPMSQIEHAHNMSTLRLLQVDGHLSACPDM